MLLTEKRPIRDLRAEIMTNLDSASQLTSIDRQHYHNSPFRLWRLNYSCVQRFMGSVKILYICGGTIASIIDTTSEQCGGILGSIK